MKRSSYFLRRTLSSVWMRWILFVLMIASGCGVALFGIRKSRCQEAAVEILPDHAGGQSLGMIKPAPASAKSAATDRAIADEIGPFSTGAVSGEAAKSQLRQSGQYESLAAAFTAARFAAEKLDPLDRNARGADFFASNPGQQLRAWFRADGVELASGIPPREGAEPWSVQVRLRAAGRSGALAEVPPRTIRADGNRVEMSDREGAMTEWFENKREGLEQGFTIVRPPPGAGPLELVMAVGGEMREVADGVRIADGEGNDVVSVTGLKAWDANGRELDARMEVRGADLALLVADAGARYPVTIDPLFANVEARLAQESVFDDNFGSSVALDGDTAVIGVALDSTARGFRAGSVYVFKRRGPLWNQQAQLTASDGTGNARFGTSVAVSGDTVVIGSLYGSTSVASEAGNAYVFVRSDTVWSEQAKLIAADGAYRDLFGGSVAVSGDTAIVGASQDPNIGGNGRGSAAAYVFARSGTSWSLQQKLTAGSGFDRFGYSVAIEGNTALIGEYGAGGEAGSAHVFVRSGTAWSQQQMLTAAGSALFGWAVALSGETALIAAPKNPFEYATSAGSAYVFVRSGTVWSQQQRIDGGIGDGFGISVALSGDTALVGAFTDDTTAAVDTGSAFVYLRSGASWSQQAQLIDSGAARNDNFGAAVALSGDTALVGAPQADVRGENGAGKACVFVRGGAAWSQQATLAATDSTVADISGSAVALSGDTALIGAPGDDTPAGADAGSAFVFARSGTGWNQQAKLAASDGAPSSNFGSSVALSGDTALVGAQYDSTLTLYHSGSAYVFVRTGTLWNQQAQLAASDAASVDRFGISVALSGDTALVGSFLSGGTGGAYVFVRSGAQWSQQQKLNASDGAQDDWFGASVALEGDTALIGANYADGAAFDSGSAYVFVRSGAVWGQQAKLFANDGAYEDGFGVSVALSGDTALIGAFSQDTAAGINLGSAYVFVRDGTSWSPQAHLTAPDGVVGDHFGVSVALSGDTALVGAYLADTAAGINAGSAYVFVRSGAGWSPQVRLSSGVDASAGDFFGGRVALEGNRALVAANADDTNGTDSGSAYIFLLGELPTITTQPVSRTVVPGTLVTFRVVATGHAPLRYLWRRNGAPIAGANASSLTIQVPTPSPFTAFEGSYDVVVSNIGGVTTSAPAVLTVNALSQFTQLFPSTPPEAQGFVFVTLTPSGIGSWRFVGEQQWRASGVPAGALTTGDRNIEFRPVPGYIQPPLEIVSVVSGGAATFIERVYFETPTPGTGGLVVTLKPDSLAAVGVPVADRAQWRLLGEGDGQWLNSGAPHASLLVAGNYLIECKPVAGRTTPPTSNAVVVNAQTTTPTLTYFITDLLTGTPPSPLPFEIVSTDTTKPYAHVGQIRSDVGSSSGFVVKPRVVATAGHVVFDDGTLSAVTGLQWLFQRQRGIYEPKFQTPRGYYVFDGYASQRRDEGTPGSSSPLSQNLDVAALYFLEDAGRTGYSGFLASDATVNEFLLSSANKLLVGYPVDGIIASSQGRMHTTPATNVAFTNAFERTYTTPDIRSSGGMSGGPLCVQFESGNYYPAAIYLGGTGQTVVRAIDSEVIDLFARAEVSGNGGSNNTGGGITHTSITTFGTTSDPGSIKITILPAAAASVARWGLRGESINRTSGSTSSGRSPGDYILEGTTISGFQAPTSETVHIIGGQLAEITFTYVVSSALDLWRQTNFQTTSNTGDAADSADPDKDNQTNLSEYAAGTNPNSAADVFKIESSTKDATTFTVTVMGKTARSYVLERSMLLSAGQWSTVQSIGPLANDAPLTLTDSSPPESSAFYRLRVTAP